MNDVLYNGVLYTIDGEVLCEFPEFKIDCYKDKTVIKIHCTNCCVVRKVQKDRVYTLREGDQVIINKNNYELHTYNLKTKKKEEKCPVFNGNRGIIRKIESSFILVDFDQWGTIFIPHYFGGNNIWATLELAYALSCHKLQGSEAPYVIVGMDNSAYLMLTREWLYTAITRAKKYCVICAETHALDRAVKTSRVPYKRTFLKEFLRKEFSEKH